MNAWLAFGCGVLVGIAISVWFVWWCCHSKMTIYLPW